MERRFARMSLFALDDYGSRYNSEINLLELKPKFIKVDISIVRAVDLLQGYYLARPGETPLPISEEALQVIREFQYTDASPAE